MPDLVLLALKPAVSGEADELMIATLQGAFFGPSQRCIDIAEAYLGPRQDLPINDVAPSSVPLPPWIYSTEWYGDARLSSGRLWPWKI